MRILGFNDSHHASICILNDGEIELFIENERLSHKKYDRNLDECIKLIDKVDYVALSTYAPMSYTKNNSYGDKISFIDAYKNLNYSVKFDNKDLADISEAHEAWLRFMVQLTPGSGIAQFDDVKLIEK